MKAPTTSGNERTRPQGRTEASVPTVPEQTLAVEPSAATTPDPREIAASLDPFRRERAIKVIDSALGYIPHRGRGARGRLTDRAMAVAAVKLIQCIGEAASVSAGIAQWEPAEGMAIAGLGSAASERAVYTELGLAVAAILAEGTVTRG